MPKISLNCDITIYDVDRAFIEADIGGEWFSYDEFEVVHTSQGDDLDRISIDEDLAIKRGIY